MVNTPQYQPNPFLDDVPHLACGVQVEGFDTNHPDYKLMVTNREGRRWMISPVLREVIDVIDGHLTTAQILDLLAPSRDAATEARLVDIIWSELVAMRVVEGEKAVESSEARLKEWPRAGSGLTVRIPLLPRQLVTAFSSVLQYLYWPPVLVALAVGSSVADLWWWTHYGKAASSVNLFARADWMQILSLVAASFFAHELGHTSACRRYGGRCGPIGFGIYWIFPVLYADVSGSWGLKRQHRAITDLGGFYFQMICAAVLIAWNCWRPTPAVAAAVILINLTFLPNLDPFLKMDGYWFLSDATGVPNLSGALQKFVARDRNAFNGYPVRVRSLIYLYCVLVVLFVSMIVVQVAQQIPKMLIDYGALVKATSTTLVSHSYSNLGSLCLHLIAASCAFILLGIGGIRLGQWFVQAAIGGRSLRILTEKRIKP
jgi:putative peptide zinc metalloprotease protein